MRLPEARRWPSSARARRAVRRLVEDRRHRPAPAIALEIAHRLVALADADRAALRLVALEQMRAAPAVMHRGELPAEIGRIADAGVHAEPAIRRHHVHGVARKEHAAAADSGPPPCGGAPSGRPTGSRNRSRGPRRGAPRPPHPRCGSSSSSPWIISRQRPCRPPASGSPMGLPARPARSVRHCPCRMDRGEVARAEHHVDGVVDERHAAHLDAERLAHR